MVVPAVVASKMVVCGGRKELLKWLTCCYRSPLLLVADVGCCRWSYGDDHGIGEKLMALKGIEGWLLLEMMRRESWRRERAC